MTGCWWLRSWLWLDLVYQFRLLLVLAKGSFDMALTGVKV